MTIDNQPVWDDGSWTAFPPLQGARTTGTCVIGLGGSGLTVIEELLARGEAVVGLDAADVAAGAAGRNGGFLLAGAYDFYHDAVRKHGRDRALAIYQATLIEMQRIAARDLESRAAVLARLAAFRLVQAGFCVAILASFGLWATWGTGVFEACFALLLAAALGIVQGASFASLAQINPAAEDRARGAGAIAQLGNLGTTCGTPLLALIMAEAGAAGLAGFLIGFSALGVAIHSWQARRRAAVSG
mgnify:CR=1 FL=1